MPSAFAELWAGVQSDLDQQWGELVEIAPQIENSDYFQGGPDSNTATFQLTGIFRDTSVIDQVRSISNTQETVDVLARSTSIDFDQRLFGTNGFPLPLEGWNVVAITQPRRPCFQIVSVEPDYIARIRCKITFLEFAES